MLVTAGLKKWSAKLAFCLVLALSAAAATPASSVAMERMQAAQVASMVGNGVFVIRGFASIGSGTYFENHIWRFASDGQVADDGNVQHIIASGYRFVPLPSAAGRWNVVGDQLCVQW